MFRLYIERKNGFENEVNRIFGEIKGFLGVDGITGLRYLNRYDIENVSEDSKEYIMNSTARYHNRVVKSMYIPKLFTKRETRTFRDIIDILYGIFNKVINILTVSMFVVKRKNLIIVCVLI